MHVAQGARPYAVAVDNQLTVLTRSDNAAMACGSDTVRQLNVANTTCIGESGMKKEIGIRASITLMYYLRYMARQ